MSGEGGIDREEIASLTERLRKIAEISKELGDVAREATGAIDDHVVADHPDLDDLSHELRNVYGNAFDDDSA